MMLLFRTISISALLLGSAYAQQTPPLAAPMFDSMPVMIPLPPNGCVWAGRPFSDGAGFCVADKILQNPLPSDKLAAFAQPIFGSFGIRTGKERSALIEAPIGRAMLRVLCSLARHGQSLRRYLERAAAWDELKERRMLEMHAQRIEAAVDAYLKAPQPAIEAMFEHVFAMQPPHLREQAQMARRYAPGPSGS